MSGNKYKFLENHDASDQADYVSDYLPDDETFESKMIAGTNTRKMLEVFGNQFVEISEFINVFAVEMDPSCADQLLTEWERMLGIPDDCYPNDVSLSERQRNALIKLAKMNVQTSDDFVALALALGVVATVESGIDSGVVFGGGDNEARFTVVISYIQIPSDTFTYTFPIIFGSGVIGLLECIFNEIKPANCNTHFIEVIPEVLGDFYWSMSQAADLWYLFNFGNYGTLTTPISLAIGDTIEFEYLACSQATPNSLLITSNDGLATFGWNSKNFPPDEAEVIGFTAIMDGVSLVTGGRLVGDNNNLIPATGRFRWHRVTLTATAATNLHRIGADIAGANRANQSIRDLTVTTVGQVYKWSLVNEAQGGSQPEENLDTNDILITSFNVSAWRHARALDNVQNGESDALAPFTISFDDGAAAYQNESLRADGLGGSFDHTADTLQRQVPLDLFAALRIPHANGFTVECLVKYKTLITPHSTQGGGFDLFRNAGILAFQIDNWDVGSPYTAPISLHLALINRFSQYVDATQSAQQVSEIRGGAAPVLGDIIHAMFTLRPSDDTMQMWLNGVSIASGTIPPSWWGTGATDLKNPTATQGDSALTFPVSAAGLDVATLQQDVKIHLLEADQSFATQQYESARVNT